MKRSPSGGEYPSRAARAFRDQAAGAVDAGRVKLHEFHVLERQPGAQHHGVAVARAGVRGGAGEISAPISAGREYRHMGAKPVDSAVVELERPYAATAALVHDEVDHEVFDEELSRMLEAP